MTKELDLTGVTIYTKDDVIDALCLIGQDVYMADEKNFKYFYKHKLIGVQYIENDSLPFIGNDDDNSKGYFAYFILAKDAKFKEEKPKEKKLRPFKDMREFFDTTGFDIGQIVHIKKDVGIEFEETTIFNGYRTDTDNTFIIFGFQAHDFEQLMEFYKYNKDGKWQSFGVEE